MNLRDNRRHKALVSIIMASKETTLDDLDRSNPIIRSATIDELDRALIEVLKRTNSGMAKSIGKLMGDKTELIIDAPEWQPLESARWLNCKSFNVLRGRSFVFLNGIDAFITCYSRCDNSTKREWIYHIYSMVGKQSVGYFQLLIKNPKWTYGKILNVPDKPTCFEERRSPLSTFSEEEIKFVQSSAIVGPIDPVQEPLHEKILSQFNAL